MSLHAPDYSVCFQKLDFQVELIWTPRCSVGRGVRYRRRSSRSRRHLRERVGERKRDRVERYLTGGPYRFFNKKLLTELPSRLKPLAMLLGGGGVSSGIDS